MDIQAAFRRTMIDILRNPKVAWLYPIAVAIPITFTDKDHRGNSIPTACVTLRGMYINPNYFLQWDVKSRIRESIVVHETLHLVFKHLGRINQFPDLKKYNIASDHLINLTIQKFGLPVPPSWYCDQKYEGWSVAKIYEDIAQEDQTKMPLVCMSSASNDPPEDTINEKGETVSFVNQLASVIETAIAEFASSTVGKTMSYTIDMINAHKSPPLDYNQMLANCLTKISDDARTWMRPNRRLTPVGILAKGKDYGSPKSIVCFIDTSGSLGKVEKGIIKGQLDYLRSSMSIDEIQIISFSYGVTNVITLNQYDELPDSVWTGGGGTAVAPAFQYLEDNFIQPEALLIYTDMAFYCRPKAPQCPVVWIGVQAVPYYVDQYRNHPDAFGDYIEVSSCL